MIGTDEPRILVEQRGHLLLVTLNRPEARNAIDTKMAWAISAAMDRFETDPELRVGVLTGTGTTFTAGADLKAVASHDARPLPPRGNFGLCAHPPNKPLIAAIEGFAVGGGLELALACDLIVAARDARLGLPEVRRGVVAAGGGAFRLPRRIPYHLAMELALTGDLRDASFFHAHGLVNRVTPPGAALAGALALAEEIIANAPLAVAATTQIVRASLAWDDAEAWEAQVPLLETVRGSADRTEGLNAFAERRSPRWTGR